MKRLFILLLSVFILHSTLAIADTIVYVTDNGDKYHSDGCQYLRSSQHAISLEDAVDQGYTPCSRCDPPRLDSSSSRPQYSSPLYGPSDSKEITALQETIEELQEEKSDLEDRVDRLEEDLEDAEGLQRENRELKTTLRDVRNYFQISIVAGAAASIFLFVQWHHARRARQDTQKELTNQLHAVSEQLTAITEQLGDTKGKLYQTQADCKRFQSAYAQLKLLTSAQIPPDVRFDEQGLPYTEPRNEIAPWGKFTVFRSSNGSRIHKKYGCCGAKIPFHRYIAIKRKRVPCSKCWNTEDECQLDEWYQQYLHLQDAEQLTNPQEEERIP